MFRSRSRHGNRVWAGEATTPEVVVFLCVGAAPGGMILYIACGLNELRRDVMRDIAGLRDNLAELRERVARIEGLFEGYAGHRADGSE